MQQKWLMVGLGTGSTAAEFIKALGSRIKEEDITVYGVPTSLQAQLLAEEYAIKIVSSNVIDLAVDGADQVDSHNYISKGGGGALLKEKLVDYRADMLVILADRTKFVAMLTKVYVEVHPLAIKSVKRELEKFGISSLRTVKGKGIVEGDQVFITESGNVIFDVKTKVKDPVAMEKRLNQIPGVMENGIFTKESIVLGRPVGAPG
ncbi:MAG: ribose 5-phosphate isomerase A [Theionarchaea archaeon]|nr:ribose 5-phosphate isomerase A [Theionarchaea archaeon]